ncbi:SDR family NAD(P)-dependent oxidoreductase, partial [Alteromonas sp. a30]|uniref:SDR family NAD(P)-dependent oxidoreductase n=1 Tax=Alteromonas sp. a30 TaxID=2730917 RepID=UPI00227E6780
MSKNEKLIVLSAQNAQRLFATIQKLAQFLASDEGAQAEIENIAYTLQVGRVRLDTRLALLVTSTQDLANQLNALIAQPNDANAKPSCVAMRNAATVDEDSLFATVPVITDKASAASQLNMADLSDIAVQQLHAGIHWLLGLDVDWEALYDGETAALPKRISLPTYAFAPDSYWFEADASLLAKSLTQVNDHDALPSAIHPLVQRNESTLYDLCFSSTLNADSRLLQDYKINGVPTLSAAVYFEMVHAAIVQLVGKENLESNQITINDMVWLQPFKAHALTAENTIRIEVNLIDTQRFEVDIYQPVEAENQQEVLFCQCLASITAKNIAHNSADMDANWKALLNQNNTNNSSAISTQDMYTRFADAGLQYGPSYQGLTHVALVGEQDATQVIANIACSSLTFSNAECMTLPPSVIDSALQAVMALCWFGDESENASKLNNTLALPYTLDSLDILGKCSAKAKIWVRYSDDFNIDEHAENLFIKVDIDIADVDSTVSETHAAEPRVVAKLRGLTVKAHPAQDRLSLDQNVDSEAHFAEKAPETATSDAVQFKEKSLLLLKQLLSESLSLPPERIDVDAEMEKYGIDSVLVLALTATLEKTFGALPKTLFYEAKTIRELNEYFVENHAEQLRVLLGDIVALEQSTQSSAVMTDDDVIENAMARRQSTKANKQERATKNGLMQSGFGQNRIIGSGKIAIIGLAGKYPQANDLDTFWDNLKAGKDSITEVPADRWDHDRYFNPDKNSVGTTYSKWGGFIDGVDQFDPLFFGISPREAEILDPQERLFLECVYQTIEDAGYTRGQLAARESSVDAKTLSGNIGVFVGVTYQEYHLYGAQAQEQGDGIALSGNPSSIANRVSYFCNWIGPSVALDTMCSSSLTAIQLACQSIRSGVCDMAIAGGTNVNVHPNKYLLLSQDNFTASNGRCMAFGEGGDGYVPSEGIGAVLLKRLEEAEQDSDHIYGVILSVAVNHGGKTNGFTVPNPLAQEDVIVKAMAEAGVKPQDISYIEAHGTGTSLGDPIEVAGLTRAYSTQTDATGFCRIGSVKSNIGHCESAAGIAGLTKVLLQFKHKQLVPSIHSQTLNPHIDFEATPFVVNRELSEWKPASHDNNKPLIAGLSSFGAGGSNAHLIVEQYIAQPEQIQHKGPYAIVLSARNQAQLKQQAQQLLDALESGKYQAQDIERIAYTLQVGREAFDWRLATIVTDLASLKATLYVALEQEQLGSAPQNAPSVRIFSGKVNLDDESLAALKSEENFEQTLSHWIAQRDFDKLLAVWVKGLEIDWNALYSGTPIRRISLPTYPFNRTRYWYELSGKNYVGQTQGAASVATSRSALHPLLHRNDSNLNALTFSSVFTGEEAFLNHHRVNEQPVLPGMTYIEAARAAVAQLVGESISESTQFVVSDLVWMQPFICSEAHGKTLKVNVEGVEVHANEKLAFAVDFYKVQPEGEDSLLCQCIVSLHLLESRASENALAESNVASILVSEATNAALVIDPQRFYQRYLASGIDYGPSHKGLTHIQVIQRDGLPVLLADIELFDDVLGDTANMMLPPGLLDSVAQSGLGLTWFDEAGNEKTDTPLSLPFALEQINIVSRCPHAMRIWVRYAEGCGPNDAVERLDIDVVDNTGGENHGKLIVQFRGFTARAVGENSALNLPTNVDSEAHFASEVTRVEPEPQYVSVSDDAFDPIPERVSSANNVTQLYRNLWREVDLRQASNGVSYSHHELVVLGETLQAALSPLEADFTFFAMKAALPQDSVPEYEGGSAELVAAKRFTVISNELIAFFQNKLKNLAKGKTLVQVLFPCTTTNTQQGLQSASNANAFAQLLWALNGICRTVCQENPRLEVQLIGVEQVSHDSANSAQALASTLKLVADSGYREVRLASLSDTALPAAQAHDWALIEQLDNNNTDFVSRVQQPGNVCLITGGVGGLGWLFAQHIAKHSTGAVLVLTGRSALNEKAQSKLTQLRALGVQAEYVSMDVCDEGEVVGCVAQIMAQYGKLDVVVHSAGILSDSYLVRKQLADVSRVLAPKVEGLTHLDLATQNIDLKAFITFSSISALGNAGQVDYATANAFMDSFFVQRNQWVASGKRRGLSLAINWPLWHPSVSGMTVNDAVLKQIEDEGWGLLTGDVGRLAFEKSIELALQHSLSQMWVFTGQKAMVQGFLAEALTAGDAANTNSNAALSKPNHVEISEVSASHDSMQTRLIRQLTQRVCELLKLRVEDVDLDTELSDYGFDSITFTTFSNDIGNEFGINIQPTIFFEYQTLSEFAEYLLEQHPQAVSGVLGEALVNTENAESPAQKSPSQNASAVKSAQASLSDSSEADVGNDSNALLQALIKKLTAVVCDLLKLRAEDVDIDTELSDYGFDSITLTTFSNEIGNEFGISVQPTIFFEYPTLGDFADYLLEEHVAEMQSVFAEAVSASANSTNVTADSAISDTLSIAKNSRSKRTPRVARVRKPSVNLGGVLNVDEPSHGSENSKIAVVGLSCEFPQAKDADAFWDVLAQGQDCIGEVPASRWSWQAIYGDPQKEVNKTNAKWGGFIDNADKFDPLFFGISPREVVAMDPQQRLLVTHVWHALEDAAIVPSSLSGSNTAIFLATASSGYDQRTTSEGMAIEGFTATSMSPSLGPNRISYLLNLHGPSEPVETACSSALVAAHRAIRCLRSGESDLAIAGGANVIVNSAEHISFSKAGMLSEDGRCKTFSKAANGYVRGEGVGIIVLKRLADAERDGNAIYATLLGSAENHGGRANSLTAPNVKAQTALLVAAYKDAGVSPDTIGYIEAHGTGTPLGDPVEVNSLKNAFATLFEGAGLHVNQHPAYKNKTCALGSVKTNIGHLELAAGIAGIIKVLLQLKHKRLVKSLHSEVINPYIELDNSPFRIVQQAQDWPAFNDAKGQPLPRRAGVSSFGFGGVNAHIVVEEYLAPNQSVTSLQAPFAIVLSAKTQQQLHARAQQLLDWLHVRDLSQPQHFARVAYTLQLGREAYEYRLGAVVKNADELMQTLSEFLQAQRDNAGNEKAALPNNCFVGHTQNIEDDIALFNNDVALHSAVETWVEKRQFNELLRFWVRGLAVDWRAFYGDEHLPLCHLPTYPFAQESFWVDENRGTVNGFMSAAIHPLLQHNHSDAYEVCFTSEFTGKETFLADHKVKNNLVLPGVAYIEMALVAAQQALSPQAGQSSKSTSTQAVISDLVWQAPIAISPNTEDDSNDQASISIDVVVDALSSDTANIAVFNTYSLADASTDKQFSECQVALYRGDLQAEALNMDWHSLNQLQAKGREIAVSDLYARFNETGLGYGSAFQGLQQVNVVFENALPQVIADITIDDIRLGNTRDMQLPCGIIDSALQASLGLSWFDADGNVNPNTPLSLPFSLASIRILGRCPRQVKVWVRYSEGCSPEDAVEKLDIDIFSFDAHTLTDARDSSGFIVAQLRGFTSRVVNTHFEDVQHDEGTPSNMPLEMSAATSTKATSNDNTEGSANSALADKALVYFKQQVANSLGMSVGQIDVDAPMEQYGIDSLLIISLTGVLEKTFGDLPKTLFFEVQTIRALRDYFMQHNMPKLQSLLGDIVALESVSNAEDSELALAHLKDSEKQGANDVAGSQNAKETSVKATLVTRKLRRHQALKTSAGVHGKRHQKGYIGSG